MSKKKNKNSRKAKSKRKVMANRERIRKEEFEDYEFDEISLEDVVVSIENEDGFISI